MAATTAPELTKGERTRLRLLEAAERIFGEKGFHATSVTEIAQEADVANGTFYVYFPSKTDLFCELVRSLGHELRTQLHTATAGLGSRAEIERAGFAAFFEWVRRHPNLYRIVRNAEFVDHDVFQEYYVRLGETYTEALKDAMAAGNVVEADPEALAYCLMGLGDFTGMRWVLWRGGKRVPDEVFETVMGFVLRGLGTDSSGTVARGRGKRGGKRRRAEGSQRRG